MIFHTFKVLTEGSCRCYITDTNCQNYCEVNEFFVFSLKSRVGLISKDGFDVDALGFLIYYAPQLDRTSLCQINATDTSVDPSRPCVDRETPLAISFDQINFIFRTLPKGV
jgi:hypothetical protein